MGGQTLKMQTVEVGMFKLPGLLLDKEELTEEKQLEINTWCEENKCGKNMTGSLYSFRNEKQREWFILKWS